MFVLSDDITYADDATCEDDDSTPEHLEGAGLREGEPNVLPREVNLITTESVWGGGEASNSITGELSCSFVINRLSKWKRIFFTCSSN